ncbi:manganese catalase family protein [Geobacillus sp. FSL W8-0032]|uniref:Manganese containing catalase n=1 Tax=Geobacillus subterraneus TaxID=129338 RepID=A0A679FHM1_9BACL|nr:MULTISPECIES: manganese catalase family protein [Geobacillus]BBW95792.1 hypothetical protein GsuE55_06250 [Geobacillus subterraneus]
MWMYENKLQYPVRVSTCNPRLAKYLIEQYGGADGELAAALSRFPRSATVPAAKRRQRGPSGQQEKISDVRNRD